MIKFVSEKVAVIPTILRYLPDSPQSTCSRDYLFTILNTFDPELFLTCINKVEALCKVNRASKKEETVEIDPEMLKVME